MARLGKGVTALLRTSRIFIEDFTSDSLKEVEKLRKKTEPSAPDLDPSFNFHKKADALYKLLTPKLPVGLATEFRQVGTPNGFELFRKLTQKLDPPRSDCAFHLANELRGLGGTTTCSVRPLVTGPGLIRGGSISRSTTLAGLLRSVDVSA